MSLYEWSLLPSVPFLSVFEGEGGDVDPSADPPADPPAPEPKDKLSKVKLSPEQQAFVNSLLAEQKRKAQEKNDQLITQLETEKNRAGTTAAEKAQLEERIETLKNEFATKEELKSRETEKKVKELEEKNRKLEAEGSTWKQRYDRDRKRIDLTQAAADHKAYSPKQVVNELFDKSRLIEIEDEAGKPTGEYKTMVKLPSVDKDGKPTVLDLDPAGAVKVMKEMHEYANLFISPATGGLGGSNLGKGGSGAKPAHEMSTAEYIAARRKARREAAGGR